MTQTQDLADTGIIVTGSSRGVGAATAQRVSASCAGISKTNRQNAPPAKKTVKQIEEAGAKAVSVGGDITTPEGRQAMLDAVQASFGGLNVLVLNASGGMESDFGEDYAMKLNRDAQVAMLEEAVEIMEPGGQIVYITSHQAHFIDDVPTMPEYEPVAKSKRAGEVALRERIPMLQEKGIGFVVVTADMIEGTITATLLNRMNPEAIETRRQAAGKLYTVEEFAAEIAALVGRDDLEVGHTEYVGGAHDYFEQLDRQ